MALLRCATKPTSKDSWSTRGVPLISLCLLALCLQAGNCQPPETPDGGIEAGPEPFCGEGGPSGCGNNTSCPPSSTCVDNESVCACNAGFQKVDCTGKPCGASNCTGTDYHCVAGAACANQEPFCGGATITCGTSTCPAGSTCLTATNQCQCQTNIVDCCGNPCGTEAACGTAYQCGGT